MADGVVAGFTHDKFRPVRLAFEENLASGADVGASFCATLEGETVVDLWGGFADADKRRPWRKDTIVNVYSTTKTMTALCALILADLGELDFDAPVARYWPEFAANGKGAVKVSHLMAHTSGLSGWKEPVSNEDLYDWQKVTSLLADQAPFWSPGTASGYHAITQGFLIGEVVRRITGRSLGTFFRQEVAEPLGADFHIGLPAWEDWRVADLIAPPPLSAPTDQSAAWGTPTELQINLATNPGVHVHLHGGRAWRGAEIPAAGGTGNARSVAEIHVILANGGVAQGRRFLSEAGCRKALELQTMGDDLILGVPARFGLGFALAGGLLPVPSPNTLYWGGYGGSLAIIDLDACTSAAYVMNRLAGPMWDARAMGLMTAMWKALGLV
jgi:CubicO group peptidase (beta-lactamase class C family)